MKIIVSCSPSAQAGCVLGMFDFRYLSLRCREPEEERPTTNVSAPPSAFDRLFAAQDKIHLPKAKLPQTKKDEMFNDVLDSIRERKVGFSVPESKTSGPHLLTVS